MRRKIFVLLAVSTIVGIGAGSGSAADDGKTVEARGGLEFKPNQVFNDTLAWHGGDIGIPSGGRLTIMSHDELPGEPHVFTIVRKGEQPKTLEALFSGSCNTCNEALGKHDRNHNERLDPGDLLVVNVGSPGLNQVGDSVAVPDGESMSVRVTAPSGTTLHFICSIHNEMQGTIRVR